MAEENGIDELGRESAAIDRNKWAGCPTAGVVYRAGKQFLTCAGLAVDQNRDFPHRQNGGLSLEALHLWILGNNVSKGRVGRCGGCGQLVDRQRADIARGWDIFCRDLKRNLDLADPFLQGRLPESHWKACFPQ